MLLKTAKSKMANGERVYWIDKYAGLACGIIANITTDNYGSIAEIKDCFWLDDGTKDDIVEVLIDNLYSKHSLLADPCNHFSNSLLNTSYKLEEEENRLNEFNNKINTMKELMELKEKLLS